MRNYLWNFGEGAQPATGVGPHTLIYGTEGIKAVSLTVSNTIGSNTKNNSPFTYVTVIWVLKTRMKNWVKSMFIQILLLVYYIYRKNWNGVFIRL
jgi:PKD repeat protein